MAIPLYDYQRTAIKKLRDGCILCGGVGTGKSRTSLAYYYTQMGGDVDSKTYSPMKKPLDLYIITTARKRDTLEWDQELIPFGIFTKHTMEDHGIDESVFFTNVTIDSWNNIGKYRDVRNGFFIFDEQRVVGYGAWTKSFLKIARGNRWILLSATPGDTWSDYIPVFIANGFFKNKTEFIQNHVVYSRFTKYPKIDRYVNTGRLVRLRNHILVDMPMQRKTVVHNKPVPCSYDMGTYKRIGKDRWDIYNDLPIETASELCYIWRKVVNTDPSRAKNVLELLKTHSKAIIFYNFDYELEILRDLCSENSIEYAEWNGHKHQPIPTGDAWVYLVQYTAGCEGWNCITTDTIIFYSQNYSYKIVEQASGRINRLNTPFVDLYCYHLKSSAPIDLAIFRALRKKQKFNESRFVEIL